MNPLLRALCLMVLLAPATTVEAAKTKDNGRTLVERLNLSSPGNAAKAFLDAYASSDYFAAYFTLSLDARFGFANYVQSFNLGGLLPGAKPSEMAGSLVWDASRPTGDVPSEILNTPALGFDDLLFAAERQGMLPFVIGNPVVEAPVSVSGAALEMPVRNVGGVPEKLTLQLIIVEDGTWRVDRVIWDGSNSEGRPWGVIADSP